MSEIKGLSKSKKAYVKARLAGKTKKDAALEAGYSESVALSAKAHIETDDVRAAFQKLIQATIPASKIVQRLNEGLDAKIKDVPDIRERREHLKLAAQYGGYHVDKQELELNVPGDGGSRLEALLAAAVTRASSSTNEK